MLICWKCGTMTDNESKTHDGEGFCDNCLKVLKTRMRARRRTTRKDMDEAAKACGLVKVRGALGGIYYE